MKFASIAAVAALGIALSGCATVIKGTSQSIVITSPPTTGANCILSSKEGNWYVTTPGTVTVSKSKEDILIKCTKPGYQDAANTIPSDFQGWTAGNIILGGLIGVGVDAATGAMNEYPNSYQVPMFAVPASPPAAPPKSNAAGS